MTPKPTVEEQIANWRDTVHEFRLRGDDCGRVAAMLREATDLCEQLIKEQVRLRTEIHRLRGRLSHHETPEPWND